MRKLILWFTLLLLSALAACAPAGGSAEPAAESATPGEEAETPALASSIRETVDSYPPALAPNQADESGYPSAPQLAAQPTGYPELTIVIPSGEVDLNDLTPVTPETTDPQVMPSPGRPGAPSPQLGVMLEAIARDLSAQTDIPADEITFISVEPMTWPNAGLGCPAEGTAYIEVQIDGMRITLQAGDEMYTYHTDGGRTFALCVDGERVSSGVVPR